MVTRAVRTLATCFACATALGAARAQATEKPVPPERRRQFPSPSGDHYLYFERCVNIAQSAAAEVGANPRLRKFDYRMRPKELRYSDAQRDFVLELTFLRDRQPLPPLPRRFVLELVRQVETADQSPWRLGELRVDARPNDAWVVEKLEFRRSEGEGNAHWTLGHTVFEALETARSGAASADAEIEATSIRYATPTVAGGGSVDVEFEVTGTAFDAGCKAFRKALAAVCETGGGPFEALRDVRGAHPLDDAQQPGSSYHFALTLRARTEARARQAKAAESAQPGKGK